MTKPRPYSRYAQQAALLMGEQIKLARKHRRWSEKNLAERAGLSLATVRKIERGDMRCVCGSMLEMAAIVGVPLFDSDGDTKVLARHIEHTRDKIALLPGRIKIQTEPIDDDFSNSF